MEEYCSGADWKNRLKSSLPGYGPATLMNRPMRTRLWGGVGAGGEKPPATRLYARHGRDLMGFKSPVSVPVLGFIT
jgi:hypothetical protein